jgi:hypothetical protein
MVSSNLIQGDHSSIMTELDSCQTQYYNTVKKLQDESEVLHRSVETKTKSYNREIKKLNELVEVTEGQCNKNKQKGLGN